MVHNINVGYFSTFLVNWAGFSLRPKLSVHLFIHLYIPVPVSAQWVCTVLHLTQLLGREFNL